MVIYTEKVNIGIVLIFISRAKPRVLDYLRPFDVTAQMLFDWLMNGNF